MPRLVISAFGVRDIYVPSETFDPMSARSMPNALA